MAILCDVGASAVVPPPEFWRARSAADGAVEREDSRLPLLDRLGPGGAALTGAFGAAHEQLVEQAVAILRAQLDELTRERRVLSRTQTSDLLREVCQDLADLTVGLEGNWRRDHPGEPLPKWPVSVIPEEELSRIGWDFHANRVQMIRNTGGSFLDAIAFLFRGDEQASFARPPTAGAVTEALSRAAARLGGDRCAADDSN